jgi:hypothetical protein
MDHRRALFFGMSVLFAGCGVSVEDVGHDLPAPPGAPASTPAPTGPKAGPVVGQYGGGQAPPGPSWEWLNPQPVGNTLRAMWGVTSTDAWIVGDGGTILHWDGAAWKKARFDSIDDDFYGVYAGQPDDVWVGGRDAQHRGKLLHFYGGTWSQDTTLGGRVPYALWGSAFDDVWLALEQGDVAHYDGGGWRVTPSPAGGIVRDFWGTSGHDVWAVGDGGSIAHFDGTSWVRVRDADIADPEKDFIGVWGSGPNDVWMVYQTPSPNDAVQGKTGFVHWNGAVIAILQEETSTCEWKDAGLFGPPTLPDRHRHRNYWEEPVSAPWLRGHRVWGVRSDYIVAQGGIDACPYFWDGTRWQIDGIVQFRERWSGADYEGPSYFSSGDDLWMVTYGGRLIRHDPSAPMVDRTPAPETSPRFVDVFGGLRDELLHIAAVPGGAWATSRYHVYRYGPGGFTKVPGAPALDAPLYNAIVALSDHDVWIAHGSALDHFDGARWVSENPPEPDDGLEYRSNIYALWASSPDDLWVAAGAHLFRGAHGAWHEIPLPPFVAHPYEGMPTVSGVAGTGPDDVWVVGAAYEAPNPEGVVYHFNGIELAQSFRFTLTEEAVFPAVWARAKDDVYVTTSPAIHWDGTHWRETFFPLPENEASFASTVWGPKADDLYYLEMWTSENPKPITRIMHWDGQSSKVLFATTAFLDAISGDAEGNVWAVGHDGAVLRLPASTSGPPR